jgi:hypothetical protein
MALTDEGGVGMTMPVSPMNYGSNGFGFGGDWAWILLLLILGWGNNGFGGYGGGYGGAGFVDASVQRGFDQNAIMSGLGDIQGAICNGFAGVEASANARQIADMQSTFALQSQFAECCCENRLGTADLKYTIATENCADRYEAAQNTRDIIDAGNRNSQAILDKLCQLELDGVKGQLAQAERENIGLQNQLNMAVVQNGMNAEVDALYNRLKNCPVPTTPVYGTTPIFTCGNNTGCGCGGSF